MQHVNQQGTTRRTMLRAGAAAGTAAALGAGGVFAAGTAGAATAAGGGNQGLPYPAGGYEWSAAPVAAPMRRGHTCVELDQAGQISRLTAIYDSSLLTYAAYQCLIGLAAEAPLS